MKKLLLLGTLALLLVGCDESNPNQYDESTASVAPDGKEIYIDGILSNDYSEDDKAIVNYSETYTDYVTFKQLVPVVTGGGDYEAETTVYPVLLSEGGRIFYLDDYKTFNTIDVGDIIQFERNVYHVNKEGKEDIVSYENAILKEKKKVTQ